MPGPIETIDPLCDYLPSGAGGYYSEAWPSNIFLHRSLYRYTFEQCGDVRYLAGIGRDGRDFVIPSLLRPVAEQRDALRRGGCAANLYPVVASLAADRFDRNASDYIYDAAALRTLDGGDFKDFRYFSRAAEPMVEIRYLPNTPIARAHVAHVTEIWLAQREGHDPADTLEIQSLAELERVYDSLGILILYSDGEPVGFSVFDTWHSDRVLVLFMKDTRVVAGLSYLMMHLLAERFAERHEINMCQDLGIPGLRKFKLKLRPSEIRNKHLLAI